MTKNDIDNKRLNAITKGEKFELEKYMPWTSYVLRPLSVPLTRLAIKYGLGADQVTWISIWVLIISIPLLLQNHIISQLLGAFLIVFWTILDSVDGNIARYWNKPSDYGYFIDTVAGYFAYIVLFFVPGVSLSIHGELGQNNSIEILIAASVSVITYLFTRLTHQKHTNIFYKQSKTNSGDINKKETKQKTSFIGIIYSNILTFYGLPPVFLIIAVLSHKVDYFIYFYTLGNILIMLIHLKKLLLKPATN